MPYLNWNMSLSPDAYGLIERVQDALLLRPHMGGIDAAELGGVYAPAPNASTEELIALA
jgi:hypothetical protein